MATYPEDGVVVVKDWNKNQFFEIPYTITDGEVTLEAPVETEHDETYTTKTEINARLAVARAEDKAVGKMWGPGKHKVFINKEPKTLLVKQESIIPTFELIKQKLDKGERIPLGVDHIDEDILKANPLLAEMVEENIGDLMDVGEIKQIATDGQDIYITDSELTNPLIQSLHAKGKLPAFSLEGPFKAGECELSDVDYVLDHFYDVTKTDFVKRGGCLDCLVGAQPNELILASKLSMEVDKLTDQKNENEKNPNDETNTPGTQANPAGEGDGGEGNPNPENNEEEGIQTPGGDNPGETNPGNDPQYVTVEQFDEFKTDLKDMITEAVQGNTQKVEAKVADMELKAKEALIGSKIDAKIREGFITPAQKPLILQAGLAMKQEDFDKHLETFKEKVWDPSQYANMEAGNSGSDGEKYTYKEYEKECENVGIKP